MPFRNFRQGGFNRGRSFGRSFGPREMTKIKCSECGKDAEVPFKPRAGIPVYCKECFFKRKGITPRERTPREKEIEEPEEAEEETKEELEETEKTEEKKEERKPRKRKTEEELEEEEEIEEDEE